MAGSQKKSPLHLGARLAPRGALALVVALVGLAMPQIAAAQELPDCPAGIETPAGASPELAGTYALQRTIASECEASIRRIEVSQSVAHEDSWMVLGVVAALVFALAFFRVALR